MIHRRSVTQVSVHDQLSGLLKAGWWYQRDKSLSWPMQPSRWLSGCPRGRRATRPIGGPCRAISIPPLQAPTTTQSPLHHYPPTQYSATPASATSLVFLPPPQLTTPGPSPPPSPTLPPQLPEPVEITFPGTHRHTTSRRSRVADFLPSRSRKTLSSLRKKRLHIHLSGDPLGTYSTKNSKNTVVFDFIVRSLFMKTGAFISWPRI